MEGDGGDVVEGLVDGAVVEGLDVGEGVGELEAGDADLVGGEAVEHEGVVGVGAVGDGDFLNGCACCFHGDAVPRQKWFSEWGEGSRCRLLNLRLIDQERTQRLSEP